MGASAKRVEPAISTEPPPPWAIVVTKQNSEEVAERSLRQAGYRTFIPRYRKALFPHGTSRKADVTLRPVFPGILFIQDWRGWPQQRIIGVIGLMRDPTSRGAGAARLPHDDMVLLIDKEHLLGFDEVKRPPARGLVVREDLELALKNGAASVEFDYGGVQLRGMLESLSKSGSAIVEFLIFGRGTRTTLDAEVLHLVPNS